MKKRKGVALIMTLMMVLSIFGGSTSAVFAEGGDSSDTAGFHKSASIT